MKDMFVLDLFCRAQFVQYYKLFNFSSLEAILLYFLFEYTLKSIHVCKGPLNKSLFYKSS